MQNTNVTRATTDVTDHCLLLQEKEFAWLLENEYTQKVEAIDKCVEV